MSAYVTLQLPMTDRECVIAALADLGFDATKLEVHETPVQLMGYRGDLRPQTADIVIRRHHVGNGSNDLGFRATPTGYQAFVSGYDHPRYGSAWLGQLGQRYNVHVAAKQERLAAAERRRQEEERQRLVAAQREAVLDRAKKMGYRVEERREGDTLRLVLVKRTY